MSYSILKIDADGRIDEEFACSGCEANLRGLCPGGKCLDCDMPICESTTGRAVTRVDDQARIAEEINCRHCGHSISGLDPHGECTQCGTPIGDTLEANLLRFANPNWLSKLAGGCVVYFLAVGIAFVLGISGGIVSAILQDPAIQKVIMAGVTIVSSFLSVIAIWFITWPPEDAVELEPGSGLRNGARFLIVTVAAMAVFTTMLPPNSKEALMAGIPTGLLQSFAGVVIYLYFRRLFLLLREKRFASQFIILAWIIGVAGLIVACGQAIWVYMGVNPAAMQPQGGQQPTSIPPGFIAGASVMCIGGLPAIVALVWAIILIIIFRIKLGRILAMSRLSYGGLH